MALFGQVPQWWGPGYEGSLIRGDAMRPMTGFLMQRAEQAAPETRWLLGRPMAVPDLRQPDESIYRGTMPKIIGGRFTFTPFQSLELGASRIMQWVGKWRQSLSNFWDGLTGKDNTAANDPNEPGTNWQVLTLSSNLSRLLAGR
ncbi:hypothetical protein J4734_19770 [Klebsiella pneumoniae]|uniref:Uncharacterized protein n=1 Tax=Klebsiella pneumoniae TaxID=573 RepID=A0A939SW63_KLEPN|nr:hypothetical protein [Klebsiella pneumoniae]